MSRIPGVRAESIISPASMRHVTAPTANSERSMASISSAGPASSSTPPRCPQRASRSPAVTRPHAAASSSSPAAAWPCASRDHARRHRGVGFGIDQDERAGGAILAVEIDGDRPQQMQRNRADVVHAAALRAGSCCKRAQVHAVIDRRNKCRHRVAGVLEQVAAIRHRAAADPSTPAKPSGCAPPSARALRGGDQDRRG